MSDEQKDIWFPAKKYGFGWGAPVTWQGWAVTLIFIGAMVLTAIYLGNEEDLILMVAIQVSLTLVFLFIVIAKGAKAKWQWGDKEKE